MLTALVALAEPQLIVLAVAIFGVQHLEVLALTVAPDASDLILVAVVVADCVEEVRCAGACEPFGVTQNYGRFGQ